MSAEELGKRLLAEVEQLSFEEVSIDSLPFCRGNTDAKQQFLDELRLADNSRPDLSFGLPPFDALLQLVTEARDKPTPINPIIELTSLRSASGKTHVLYHIVAVAVLPASYSGRHSCVVVVDTDNRFSVLRLVTQMQKIVNGALSDSDIEYTLRHVHIYRPQSLSSTIATVQAMPDYLFDSTRHYSADRPLAFIALDSASAFVWQARADAEDTVMSRASISGARQAPSYADLAAALLSTTKTLRCPLIYTAWAQSPVKNAAPFNSEAHSFRSSLPAPWPTPRRYPGPLRRR